MSKIQIHSIYGKLLFEHDAEDNTLRATLELAIKSGANLYGANLESANLESANLESANLESANLYGANLYGANLVRANLVLANLESAGNWIPKIPNIHQRVYEAASAENALEMSSWHGAGGICGTTHCRAGWVVALAGEGGRVMEGIMGTAPAAALIYIKSDPTLKSVPDFYCSNEVALEDMKRLAELEATKD